MTFNRLSIANATVNAWETFDMEKALGQFIRDNGLDAVKSLSAILERARDGCSPEQYELLRKGIGLAIGKIQMEVLEVVYREHPDLDDLK
ncbi:MAG TPA: hypothetical protein VFE23_12270 [Usitatibacter sp.]|nr:hypothetical protein [Usitatibacter sp.]